MTTVREWLEDHGEEDVDVWDSEVDIGRAWGLPYGDEDAQAVQGWILDDTYVMDDSGADITADVWGFVLRHIGIVKRYAFEWSCLRVDETDEGMANGVVLVMALMSGEAPADSYSGLARMIRGVQ